MSMPGTKKGLPSFALWFPQTLLDGQEVSASASQIPE
jgi:hypothetical protein